MSELLWILGATLLVSSISFIGAASLAFKQNVLNRILLALLALAAGTLIGGAFLHLLPEAIETQGIDVNNIFLITIFGFMVFFVLEKMLWHRCYNRNCSIHTFAYLNLIGDAAHNFLDGLILAASFLVSIPIGLATTISVAVHEIPQEIADFGVIVYGGFKPKRALLMNFMSALTAVAGGLIGFFFFPLIGNIVIFWLPFAAGAFVYIAASNLIPEIHKKTGLKQSAVSFTFLLIGVIIMWALKAFLAEGA